MQKKGDAKLQFRNVSLEYFFSVEMKLITHQDAEGRPEDDKICCRLCLNWNSMSYCGGWILPRSFGAHRTSDVHMKSLELAAAQAARDAALAAPAQPRIQEFAILQNISLEQAPQEGSSTHRHEETQAERDMWAGWDRSNDPLEIGESLD